MRAAARACAIGKAGWGEPRERPQLLSFTLPPASFPIPLRLGVGAGGLARLAALPIPFRLLGSE
jgi:hypothetical protein